MSTSTPLRQFSYLGLSGSNSNHSIDLSIEQNVAYEFHTDHAEQDYNRTQDNIDLNINFNHDHDQGNEKDNIYNNLNINKNKL